MLNIYQARRRASAVQIGEVLYHISRQMRRRASEVRFGEKSVEIIESHLLDAAALARSLLVVLGRKESDHEEDPKLSLLPVGQAVTRESLLRLADNVLFSVRESDPEATEEAAVQKAVERFRAKLPSIDAETATRVIASVAHQPAAAEDRPQQKRASNGSRKKPAVQG